MPWNSTYRTLNEAVEALVSIDSSLSGRLSIAINVISGLRKDDFPLQCRELSVELNNKIDRYRNGENNPSFQSELSLEIYQLFKKLAIEGWPSYL